MKYLHLVGRILFAAIFLAGASRHFTAEGIGHAAELGLPLASFLVPLSGLIAIAGGLSIALGFRMRWGAVLIILFLVPVTFAMHAFWNVTDPTLRHIQLSMFMKNISMLGAAMFIAAGDTKGPGLDSLWKSK